MRPVKTVEILTRLFLYDPIGSILLRNFVSIFEIISVFHFYIFSPLSIIPRHYECKSTINNLFLAKIVKEVLKTNGLLGATAMIYSQL